MLNKLLVITSITLTIVLYQNCAPSWEAINANSELTASSRSGIDDTPGTTPPGNPGGGEIDTPDGFPSYKALLGTPNFRLLSNREIKNSISTIILNENLSSLNKLPSSNYDPFDNYASVLTPNLRLTEFLHEFAKEFATEFSNNTQLVKLYANCDAKNNNCLEKIINDLGLVFFRRPLTAVDLNSYKNLVKSNNTDLNTKNSLQILVEAMVQDPYFLYKWEVGSGQSNTQIPLLFNRLDTYQYISRITYFLLGTSPGLETLKLIQNNHFSTFDNIRSYIQKLQQTDQYKTNMMNFFGYWLGFAGLSNNPDKKSRDHFMFRESSNLVWDSIFKENKDWTRIFLSKKTYINKPLADIYGFNIGRDGDHFSWFNYPDDDRMGALAHLSFLSDWEKRQDTSTTARGYHIFKRLFCGQKQPLPLGIDVDQVPGGDLETPCKIEKEQGSLLKTGTSCIGCHTNMNPIGYGIENYGIDGRYRTHQKDEVSCKIDGQGFVSSVNKNFSGISGLVEIGFSTKSFQSCMAEHLIEYGIGIDIENNKFAVISKAVSILDNSNDFEKFVEQLLTSQEFQYSQRGQ